ncbi:hypothetical protein ACFU96_47265 [Streptomyces sp. NPDC057620]|uniref:hypothetical protein n=1 Tax=Streptomyces sp. NPDC057620 TaxID=3346185 RepID=UPI0036C177E8
MPDDLWSLMVPWLPGPAQKLVEDRPPVLDRQAVCGILHVPHTGIQGDCPFRELGFGQWLRP